ncbi:MAG TPA: copper amine oxidase [Negativicutes bacterium]|jgi:hypothetical protein
MWLRMGLLVAVLILAIGKTALAGPAVAKDILELPEWDMTSTAYGGKLLLSDSPEMVTADGVMYQDTVNGSVRLFFHHVNDTKMPKKIVVLLENAGSQPAHIMVHQYGLGGPGYDYLAIGKEVQMAYLKGTNLYSIEVAAKETTQLIPGLDHLVVQPNMLLNGMYDFITDQPVKVRVIMLPVKADIKKFAKQAKVLPADQYHLRGTFEGKDRMLIPTKVYDPKQDGVVVLTLADNQLDRYVAGIDATDGTPTLNYGNYGVVYRLFLPSEASDNITYFLNPRGGEYAGGIGVKYKFKLENPVPTPEGRVSFGSDVFKDVATIGCYQGGQSLWLTFSPPGASNLPVKLMIVPKKE